MKTFGFIILSLVSFCHKNSQPHAYVVSIHHELSLIINELLFVLFNEALDLNGAYCEQYHTRLVFPLQTFDSELLLNCNYKRCDEVICLQVEHEVMAYNS